MKANGLTLELSRVLPAPARETFEAFVEPERLRAWWGPHGFSVPALEFRPRAGGSYWIEMRPPEGEPFRLIGEFREADPPRRLAYTFAWDPPDPDDVVTLVELSFRQAGGSTEVALAQGPFATEPRRALHLGGWTESLDRLERLLAGQG